MGPTQTIHQFFCLTGGAETVIQPAVRQGLAEPGPFFRSKVLRAVDGALDTMLEASEALALSRGVHGPAADDRGWHHRFARNRFLHFSPVLPCS
jgi:hypothetical protein